MPASHLALCVLLGICLASSIVELGLTAYVATFWRRPRQIPYWIPYQGYIYRSIHIDPPAIVDLLLFSACWSVLASIAAIVLPWFYTTRGPVSATLNTVLGVTFSVVFIASSTLWIACFADIETLLNGGTSSNVFVKVVIAFAVVLWQVPSVIALYMKKTNIDEYDRVLFLALFMLTTLSLCGVLSSTWAGYQAIRKTDTDPSASKSMPAAQETREVDHAAHDEHGAAAPAVQSSPSEFSRDTEATHNQSVRRVTSISSPSAVDSVELSGVCHTRHEHGVSPV